MDDKRKNTSWQKVGKWYNKIVGEKGHYYHEKVIFPNLLRILKLEKQDKVLDLGCGQGIFGRKVPSETAYLGIDIAAHLIGEAKKLDKSEKHKYVVSDITKDILLENNYDKAVIILAFQNLQKPFKAITNAAKALKKNGEFVLVLNHPYYRIPKHSDWGVDKEKRVQYRKVDMYMSKLEIPIESNPFHGKKSEKTWSFHYPLGVITEMLFDNGFLIETIEEWVSDKKSEGGAAFMEDKARKEIPLFMAIVARKC